MPDLSVDFNVIPMGAVFALGNGNRYIKLRQAIPDAVKQPVNAFDLQMQTYCTFTSKHPVRLVKRMEQFDP